MEGKETSRHRERKREKGKVQFVLESGARKMQKVGIGKVQIYKWAHLSYLCTLASHLACAKFASGLHQRWACLEIDLLTQFSIIGASIPHGSKQTCLHARPAICHRRNKPIAPKRRQCQCPCQLQCHGAIAAAAAAAAATAVAERESAVCIRTWPSSWHVTMSVFDLPFG